MGKGSAPSPPDPWQSAAAQYEYGTAAAGYNKALNGSNTVGPTGSTSQQFSGYDPATGAPIYTTVTSLSPQQQQIFNEQQGNQIQSGQTAGMLGREAQQQLAAGVPQNVAPTSVQMGINASGVPGIVGQGNLDQFAQQQQQAAYNNQEMYLQPQLQQQQQQLRSQLINSGAQPGSQAYDNAMNLLNLQQQQEQTGAFNNSFQQGLAGQQALYGESANTNQQLFGQATAEQQAANQAAAQQYGQELSGLQSQIQLQQLPMNEYSALEGGVQANLPSFGLGGSQASVQAPNIEQDFNNQYQGELAAYNSQVSQSNADVGAAGSVAAMVGMYML